MKNKMKMLGMVVLFAPSLFASSYTDTTVISKDPHGTDTVEISSKPYVLSETTAMFPGGDAKLKEFIIKNIKYPTVATQQGISGKVIATIEINEEGTISKIEIIHGIGGGCDEEVIRVLSSMPVWEPAIQAGNKIKTKKKLSFNFTN